MIWQNILPIIIVSISMTYLYLVSKKKPKKDEIGNIILKLPKLYSILGILSLTSGIGIFLFVIITSNREDLTIPTIGCLCFIILGSFLFAKGHISHIKINESGIIETTMFGFIKEIQWKEITNLSFGNISLELKIKSSNKSIKAHFHLIGFEVLVNKLEEKTGSTKTEMGIPE